MKKEKKKPSPLSQRTIVILLVAAVIVVAGYIILTNDSKSSAGGKYEVIAGVQANYSKEKVEIIEIFDFMCPHCYELHKTAVIEELKSKYGDKVEVRYVVLHFIEDRHVSYERAILPVLAFEYARDNGKGEEMMNALFQAYHESKLDITDINLLAQIVGGIGLDASDLENRLYAYGSRVEENDELVFNFYFKKVQPIVPTVIMAGNLNIVYPEYTTFENMDKIIAGILGNPSLCS